MHSPFVQSGSLHRVAEALQEEVKKNAVGLWRELDSTPPL
jgi:hypothetical protein